MQILCAEMNAMSVPNEREFVEPKLMHDDGDGDGLEHVPTLADLAIEDLQEMGMDDYNDMEMENVSPNPSGSRPPKKSGDGDEVEPSKADDSHFGDGDGNRDGDGDSEKTDRHVPDLSEVLAKVPQQVPDVHSSEFRESYIALVNAASQTLPNPSPSPSPSLPSRHNDSPQENALRREIVVKLPCLHPHPHPHPNAFLVLQIANLLLSNTALQERCSQLQNASELESIFERYDRDLARISRRNVILEKQNIQQQIQLAKHQATDFGLAEETVVGMGMGMVPSAERSMVLALEKALHEAKKRLGIVSVQLDRAQHAERNLMVSKRCFASAITKMNALSRYETWNDPSFQLSTITIAITIAMPAIAITMLTVISIFITISVT